MTTNLPPLEDFATIAETVAATAREAPSRLCLVDERRNIAYGEFDALADRVAASLQRRQVAPQSAVAVCAASSIEYLAVFLGALRAGVVVAPLAPSSTPAS
ncbi:MAG TPA: AMP-binding protein, partial [Roseiarcus sp.]|nr:AMP-binding protein [Roseiarcus sp.]